jgi:hypothetical protein
MLFSLPWLRLSVLIIGSVAIIKERRLQMDIVSADTCDTEQSGNPLIQKKLCKIIRRLSVKSISGGRIDMACQEADVILVITEHTLAFGNDITDKLMILFQAALLV